MSPPGRVVVSALIVLAALLLAVGAGPIAGVAAQPAPQPAAADMAEGRIIVKFKPGTWQIASDAVTFASGGQRREIGFGYSSVSFDPARSVTAEAARYRANPVVQSAEPVLIRRLGFEPNDPLYPGGLAGRQWNLTRIGVQPAWDLASGAGVVVAVLDSGLDGPGGGYTDRPANVLPGRRFFVENNVLVSDANVDDSYGHGMHVAGTIAQATNNGVAVAGVAYGATILPVKICTGFSCPVDAIVAGIAWAVDNGATVINMSLGGPGAVEAERVAVESALARGVSIVAAAGNGSSTVLDYPAGYAGVMAVGATDWGNSRTWYSNVGSGLWIMAPGGDSIDLNGDGAGDYIYQQTCNGVGGDCTGFNVIGLIGTSMATPHVTGVVALMKSVNPGLTPAQLRALIGSSALDLGAAGYDTATGNGLVQAWAAVCAALGSSCPSRRFPVLWRGGLAGW